MEFRFPVYGRVVYDGIELELRQGDRAVVRARREGRRRNGSYSSIRRSRHTGACGLVPERVGVACNGLALPLQPTRRPGSSSAVCDIVRGSRHGACIRPFPMHAPLVFDLSSKRRRGTHSVDARITWLIGRQELRDVSGKLE